MRAPDQNAPAKPSRSGSPPADRFRARSVRRREKLTTRLSSAPHLSARLVATVLSPANLRQRAQLAFCNWGRPCSQRTPITPQSSLESLSCNAGNETGWTSGLFLRGGRSFGRQGWRISGLIRRGSRRQRIAHFLHVHGLPVFNGIG